MRGSMISDEPRFGIWNGWAFLDRSQKLMVGCKTDSVYERYNVASKRDLDVAREKMERNAMERLYSASNPASNSHPDPHHFARDGQSLGRADFGLFGRSKVC